MILLMVYLTARYGGRVGLDQRSLPRVAGAAVIGLGMTLGGVWSAGEARAESARPNAGGDAETVRADQLMPLREAAARFVVATDEDAPAASDAGGEPVDVKLVHDGQQWRLEHAAWKTQDLRLSASGNLEQSGERLAERDSVITLMPRVTVLPRVLRVGEVDESRASVRVTNLQGDKVKAEGEYVRHVELLGRSVVETGAGSFDAYVVRTTERFKFSMARAEVVTTTSYVLGMGPVRQHIAKSVTKLGVFTDHSTRTMTLSEMWQED